MCWKEAAAKKTSYQVSSRTYCPLVRAVYKCEKNQFFSLLKIVAPQYIKRSKFKRAEKAYVSLPSPRCT